MTYVYLKKRFEKSTSELNTIQTILT